MRPALARHATIVAAAGRTSTARMLDAVAAKAGEIDWPPIVVLLSRGHERVDGDAVGRSWSEVLSAVDPSALIIVPSGDDRLRDAALLTGATVVTVGFDVRADIRGTALVAHSRGTDYDLELGGVRHSVRLTLLGEHLAENSLAAIAAAVAAGVDARLAIGALESLESAGTGIMQPLRSDHGALVIDDSKSMVPESVVAALKALAMFGTEGHRTVAVLGGLDLADDADDISSTAERHREAHDRIGRIVVRLNIASLIVVGQDARHIHNAAGLEGSWNGESVLVDTLDEAYHRVRDDLGRGDAVLVKLAARGESLGLASRIAAGGDGR